MADWEKEMVVKRSLTGNEHQIEGTRVDISDDWTGAHCQKGMPLDRNEECNCRIIHRVCQDFEKKPREELKTEASERNGCKKETNRKSVEVGMENTGGENNLEKKDELRREKKKQDAEYGESFKLNNIKLEEWKCRCYVSGCSAKQTSNLEGNRDDRGCAARREVSRFHHLTVPFKKGLRELVFEVYALVEALLQRTTCKRDSRREDGEWEAMEVCNPKKQQKREFPMGIEQQQSTLEESQQMFLKALDEAIAGKETLELELNQSQAQVFELERQLLDLWRRQHRLLRELESWQVSWPVLRRE
uniref:BICD family-like cargo adapter 1 n=1 Tax=Myxine glutinosa TaxID=7769 RepID=UPI00358FD3B5